MTCSLVKQNQELCLIAEMLAYLAARGLGLGLLFQFRDGRPLNVRMALKTLGLSKDCYSGHSFRIGAATTAAECGVQELYSLGVGQMKEQSLHVSH